VGLEQGPLSLVSTTKELPGRKNNVSGLENRDYSRGDPRSWPRGTLHPRKLALTFPTSCGRSVGIVRSMTQATEFVFCVLFPYFTSSSINGQFCFTLDVSVLLNVLTLILHGHKRPYSLKHQSNFTFIRWHSCTHIHYNTLRYITTYITTKVSGLIPTYQVVITNSLVFQMQLQWSP
jgi:hypothetical protein